MERPESLITGLRSVFEANPHARVKIAVKGLNFFYGPQQALANRLRRGFRTLLAQRGADLAYGRTLPRLLRTAGLSDVRAEAYFPVTGPACDALEYATVEQVRDRLVDAGLATRDEIDEHLANVAAGRLDLAMAPMITAWGRRA